MIVYRHCDARYPFLWESPAQPPARWHGAGEGPTHYLADTPQGAWAEFLRHEEIVDPSDLAGIRRAVWSVEIGDPPQTVPDLPDRTTRGGLGSYPACRDEARRLRASGATGLTAPSAALEDGAAAGRHVDGGLHPGRERDGVSIVLFGLRPDLEGWEVVHDGSPGADVLAAVRPLSGTGLPRE